MNIEEIEKMGVAGNAFHDQHIFNACHEFIINFKNSIADRLRALNKINMTMGDYVGENTEADLKVYMDFAREISARF